MFTSIDSAPKDTKVLVIYQDGNGMKRTTIGYYNTDTVSIHGANNPGFAPLGWIEFVEGADQLYALEYRPILWCPIPTEDDMVISKLKHGMLCIMGI